MATAFLLAICLVAAGTGDAFAHAADRGFVMLLPTGYYLFGGAAAVALSFTVLVLPPPQSLAQLLGARLRLSAIPFDGRMATSLLSFAVVLLLWLAGLFGSRDPLSNPLPLVFWTLFWTGFTMLVGIVGNLWRWVDPWYGVSRLILLVAGRRDRPPFVLPERLGYLGAILLLFGFGWFELIYSSPEDPELLARVLIAYWVFNLVGIVLFGHAAWTGRVELFSVFFAFIARFAIFQRVSGPAGRDEIYLRFPGGRLDHENALPPSGMVFLLLALATVSFDGLMRTFFWLGWIGVNPLEYPGRSAVMVPNTGGLIAMAVILSGAFVAALWLGGRLAALHKPQFEMAGLLVWSIGPIALAYHVSH